MTVFSASLPLLLCSVGCLCVADAIGVGVAGNASFPVQGHHAAPGSFADNMRLNAESCLVMEMLTAMAATKSNLIVQYFHACTTDTVGLRRSHACARSNDETMVTDNERCRCRSQSQERGGRGVCARHHIF